MKAIANRFKRRSRGNSSSMGGASSVDVSSAATPNSTFSDSATSDSGAERTQTENGHHEDYTGICGLPPRFDTAYGNGSLRSSPRTNSPDSPQLRPAAVSKNKRSSLSKLSYKEAKGRIKSRIKNFKVQQNKIRKYHQNLLETMRECGAKTFPEQRDKNVYRLKKLFEYGLSDYYRIFEKRSLLSVHYWKELLELYRRESDVLLKCRIETEQEIAAMDAALDEDTLDTMLDSLSREVYLGDPDKILETTSTVARQRTRVDSLRNRLQKIEESVKSIQPEFRLQSPKERKGTILGVLKEFNELKDNRDNFYSALIPRSDDVYSEKVRIRKEAVLYRIIRLLTEVSKPKRDSEHSPSDEVRRYKFCLNFEVPDILFACHCPELVDLKQERMYVRLGISNDTQWELNPHSSGALTCWSVNNYFVKEIFSFYRRSYELQSRLNRVIEDQRQREGRILQKWCRRLFGYDHSIFLLEHFKRLDRICANIPDDSSTSGLCNVMHTQSEEICPITVPRPRILKVFMKWYAKELRNAINPETPVSAENLETMTEEMLWARLHTMCFGEGKVITSKDSNVVTLIPFNDSLTTLDQEWERDLHNLRTEPVRSFGLEKRFIDDTHAEHSDLFKSAATLLTAMPLHYSPKKMLECLVLAVDLSIHEIVARGGDGNLTGDDMVPLLATLCSRSYLTCPHLCIAYMKAYGIDMNNIAGREEYALTTFSAAISWLHSRGKEASKEGEVSAFVPHVAEKISGSGRYRAFSEYSLISTPGDEDAIPDWLTTHACVPLELYMSDEEKLEKEKDVEEQALEQLKEWLQQQRLLEDTLRIFQ